MEKKNPISISNTEAQAKQAQGKQMFSLISTYNTKKSAPHKSSAGQRLAPPAIPYIVKKYEKWRI